VWVGWAAVGLGVLTKGPIGLLPCLVITAWLVVLRDWRSLGRLRWVSGSLLAAGIAAPWYLVEIALHGWRFIALHFGYEVITRAVSSEFAGPTRGPLFYLKILPGEIVPWTFLVGAAVVWAVLTWRRMSTDDRTRFALLAVWSVGVMALFSAARYKLPHYTLPAYPPLLLAAGAFVDATVAGVSGWSRVQRGTLVATAGVVALICAAVAALLCLLFPFDMVGTALLALLAVVAGIAGLQIGRRSIALGAVVCIAALLYPIVAWRWSDEVSGHFQAAQALGKVAARIAPLDAPLASTLLHPSLVHYARRPVDFLQSPKDVARFLAEPSRRYLVLSCRDVEATIRSARTPLQVVARQPVFAPRLGHLLDGRMMTPANELCLVMGRHR
jgi:4-amino-4-deoxy-L-arabinose transferase-like glycosyltransferase